MAAASQTGAGMPESGASGSAALAESTSGLTSGLTSELTSGLTSGSTIGSTSESTQQCKSAHERNGKGPWPALTVVAVGVSAALHLGKLPPAINALQAATGMSLVDAGVLLSLMQLAGMLGGLFVGAWADGLGARRSIAVGLFVLALASLAGGFADTPAMLMALRAIEGCGFLLVVLPAPALIRRLAPANRGSQLLGFWAGYMPTGIALALLVGPFWIEAFGWRSWWWLTGACSASMAILLWLVVPRDAPAAPALPANAPKQATLQRLHVTLTHRGPWLVAMTFSAYSSQWLAVVSFLPVIYEQNGVAVAWRGALTALASAVNIVGNLAGGRLLQRGVPPALLLYMGFVTMGLSAVVAFAGAGDAGASGIVRYLAVLVFSMVGGVIPASLFLLALRVAPTPDTVSTTVGWMQQWTAFGQFVCAPVLALIATAAGGWHLTWTATGATALAGLLLAWRLDTLLPRHPA